MKFHLVFSPLLIFRRQTHPPLELVRQVCQMFLYVIIFYIIQTLCKKLSKKYLDFSLWNLCDQHFALQQNTG